MSFSSEYVRLVLNENFEDAKRLFLGPMLALHEAHLVMLAERGIVAPDDADRLARALDALDRTAIQASPYDAGCEDLFFHVDRLLADACGAETTGRLHTARSRNDIDMTIYRMRVRQRVIEVLAATLRLRATLIEFAERHRTSIMAALTHTQPAQPTTVAHYLLAVIERIERDSKRLFAAYHSVNQCPLGACAITGTGFPIARERTSQLLGFERPTGNTYGSIAAADYLLEAAAAVGTCLVGLGRFVQDLLFWCTAEVGYLRLADGLVQVSSIMPQKRNPVALEHARALASRALGEVGAVPTAIHNTPFGDIVDTEDDLQPLVDAGFADATRALALVAAALDGAELDVARMRARAEQGWITATELADTLARDHGVPFMTAHAITAAIIAAHQPGQHEAMARAIERECARHGHLVPMTPAEVAVALSVDRFIAVRTTPGGPAPDATRAAIATSRTKLIRDEADLTTCRARLDDANRQRRQALDDIRARAEAGRQGPA